MRPPQLRYTEHALNRMDQWAVEARTLPVLIAQGETIEEYPHDRPYPSRLVLGWENTGPVHVVLADIPDSDEAIVITVYRPEPERWDNGFRTRRQS